MVSTFVVPSCDTVAEVSEPGTLKMLTPDLMYYPCRLVSPLMVCAPVRYVPAAIVWSLVVGVMVAAAFVVSCSVSEPLTDTVPAVPDET